MQKKRPVNLDLRTIQIPIPAVASILHRISGIILFLGLPFLIYLLHLSLRSPNSFADLTILFNYHTIKFFIWVILSALLYHLCAGIRHLLMDFGIGETKMVGRYSAQLVIVLAILLIIFAGVWLW